MSKKLKKIIFGTAILLALPWTLKDCSYVSSSQNYQSNFYFQLNDGVNNG